MSEAVKYTITVGNSTNVTATSYKYDLSEVNNEQIQQLEALQQSGDISLKLEKDENGKLNFIKIEANSLSGLLSSGAIAGISAKGLLSMGVTSGYAIEQMMEIDGLPPDFNRQIMHESTMAAINRFSPSDPEKMSLSELMTCLMMMVYMSESERREALQTAKGKQLLIQMDQARMAWAQSREAAERAFDNALMSSIGTICSGVISAGAGIVGGIFQSRVNHHKKMAVKAEDDIKKADLAKQYKTALDDQKKYQTEFDTKKEELKNVKQKPNDGNTQSEKLAIEQGKTGLDTDTELRNTPEYKKLDAANNKVEALKKKITDMGGEPGEGGIIIDKNSKDGVQWGKEEVEIKGEKIQQDIDKDILTNKATYHQDRAAVWQNRVNMLQSAGALGHIAAGGFQIGAAYAQKDAEFLRAEAQLTDAYRGFSAAMVQNIDSSAQQALQQMEKLVSSLKEVFRAMYDIECSIARNI